MGASYQILGKSVPSYKLAIATLGAVTLVALPKPWGPGAPQHPPIVASSDEEAKFIEKYVQDHLNSEKASKGH